LAPLPAEGAEDAAHAEPEPEDMTFPEES